MKILENVKDKFEAWLDKVDGQDEINEMKARQEQAKQHVLAVVETGDKAAIAKALDDFQRLCFEDGFSQGCIEGSMTEME